MKKLNICQCMIALGINALIEDGRLAELNADGNALATIGNEFYDDASNADLEDDIRVVDVEGRGFALMSEAAFESSDDPEDGSYGLIVETKSNEPGLFLHEQIYSGGAWIDEEE
jgi:hypothetical protein